MDTWIISELYNQISSYILALDWAFIITFIILCYGIRNIKFQLGNFKVKTIYLVLVLGWIYASIFFYLSDYSLQNDKDKILILFQSVIFTVVFHKFLIEGLMHWVGGRLPENLGKYIMRSKPSLNSGKPDAEVKA